MSIGRYVVQCEPPVQQLPEDVLLVILQGINKQNNKKFHKNNKKSAKKIRFYVVCFTFMICLIFCLQASGRSRDMLSMASTNHTMRGMVFFFLHFQQKRMNNSKHFLFF